MRLSARCGSDRDAQAPLFSSFFAHGDRAFPQALEHEADDSWNAFSDSAG